MREEKFDECFDFLKQTVENSFGNHSEIGKIGKNVFGVCYNPDNLTKEEIENEFFRVNNDDGIFEKGDVVFESVLDENGHEIFLKKLSPELVEKIKKRPQ